MDAVPSTSDASQKVSRSQRQRDRAAAWRRSINLKVIAERDAARDRHFGTEEDAERLREEVRLMYERSVAEAELKSQSVLVPEEQTVIVPLPIPTDNLQTLSSDFYHGMIQSVENGENPECTFSEFIRIVQLQLLNQIHPPEQTIDLDPTAVKIQLPNVIQEIVNSAQPFDLPIEKIPNGALIRSHTIKEPPAKTITFEPTLVPSDAELSAQQKSRFLNIFNLTQSTSCRSEILNCSFSAPPSGWPTTDAAAVRRFLARIPSDAHPSWKIGSTEPVGQPQTNYLLFGPVVWMSDPNNIQDIRQPPKTTSRTLYRLSGGMDVSNIQLYGTFSDPDTDKRLFEANYRRIMERSKVQKLFKDMRRVPLNQEQTIFLKY